MSFKLKNLSISPGLVLSPMSGVTSCAFRRLILELNPGSVGLVVSEFISIEGMTRDSRKSLEMMHFHDSERPVGIQIFGYDIDRMRDAAMMVQDAGADLIDINCGCPAPKVVKRGGGCELMKHPQHLAKMFKEVRRSVSIPFTMKMRSGWDEESKNSLQIALIAEGEGLDGLTIHGRTRSQMYRGEADWQIVEHVAESVKIPVSGSGDIVSRESAVNRWSSGKIAGLFIGRAAIENPYVFSQIHPSGNGQSGNHKNGTAMINPKSNFEILKRYNQLLNEENEHKSFPNGFDPERINVGKLKQLASQLGNNAPWVKPFCRALKLSEQLEILKRYEEHIEC